MKEIEVKVLEIDPKDVVSRLKALGATKVEQGLVHAKAYDFPGDRLRGNGEYVRVRKIADRIELVFKSPLEGAQFKVHDETEVTVSDFDTTCRIFEKLGMYKFADMEKYRATFLLEDVKVEFDKYAGLPWFFEVEGPDEESVARVVTELGFDFDDRTKVVAKTIRDVYGDHVHFVNFDEKGESPDYDSLFEE